MSSIALTGSFLLAISRLGLFPGEESFCAKARHVCWRRLGMLFELLFAVRRVEEEAILTVLADKII